MNGCLISLEGGEGAGKSTVLAGLRAHIEASGIVLHITREPGGTALGEAIRRLVLDGALSNVCAESELLLMFAARAQLVREVIQPALHRATGSSRTALPMRASPIKAAAAANPSSALPSWNAGLLMVCGRT